MCRSANEPCGKRRCADTHKRARDRARYAAQQATEALPDGTPRTYDTSVDTDPFVDPSDTRAHHGVDDKVLARRIARARAVIDDSSDLIEYRSFGLLVTRDGVEVENAVRDVGYAILARADLSADSINAELATNPAYATIAHLTFDEVTAAEQAADARVRDVERKLRDLDRQIAEATSSEEISPLARFRDDFRVVLAMETQRYDNIRGIRNARAAIIRDRILTELRKVRPFGPPEGGVTFHPDSDPRVVAAIQPTLDRYPTEWITETCSSPLLLTISEGEAAGMSWYFRDHEIRRGEVVHGIAVREGALTDERATRTILTHEFGHAVTLNNRTRRNVEEVFVQRRTTPTGDITDPDNRANRNPAQNLGLFKDNGEYREGNFVIPYVGKEYDAIGVDAESREAFSVGIESIMEGAYGSLHGWNTYRPDRDHAALIVGMLATL